MRSAHAHMHVPMLYVAGGMDANQSILSTMEVFDSSTGEWNSALPIATARFGAAVIAMDGKLYVVGGIYRCKSSHCANRASVSSVEVLQHVQLQ